MTINDIGLKLQRARLLSAALRSFIESGIGLDDTREWERNPLQEVLETAIDYILEAEEMLSELEEAEKETKEQSTVLAN